MDKGIPAVTGEMKEEQDIRLSIIMPCYNVEKTIIRALESIDMQITDFRFEAVLIDDASTDATSDVVAAYRQEHPWLRVLRNEENMGNAKTFHRGLCEAAGRYFCVLDGDDYYTIPDKLQRQVSFLDRDTREEYVAVATQYIMDLGHGEVHIPDRSDRKEYSYVDFLTQNAGYYHTSTYMYRNIFAGNVPEYFTQNLYRGDTPRTTFHLMFSGKKVRILDFVGSAYSFELQGIWSGLKEKQQFEYQINYQTKHRENVETSFEQKAADRLIRYNQEKLKQARDSVRKYPAVTLDEALVNLKKAAVRFAFEDKQFVFQRAYYSEYLDTLCASLGYIFRVNNKECVQDARNEDHIAIVNGILNPQGGGIFAEIRELIGIYSGKTVFLFVTDMDSVSEETMAALSDCPNLRVICPPAGMTKGRLEWLYARMKECAPYRAYYYCSHKDTYGIAMVNRGYCENLCLFSFDHGYLCGITNPFLDRIIAKRPVDYTLLRKQFAEKVMYIPAWSRDAQTGIAEGYRAFSGHSSLITACGAARYYKVDGKPPLRYVDCILDILKATRGKHYHFGEMPEEVLGEIRESLSREGLPEDSFVNIPWSDNLPRDMLLNHVDVFIEPFPVVSYKLTLAVLSAGIPVLAHRGMRRMSITDFVPAGSPVWKNREDLVEITRSFSADTLNAMSAEATAYFTSCHRFDVVAENLRANRSFPVPAERRYPDNTLENIMDSLRLFGEGARMAANGVFSTRQEASGSRQAPIVIQSEEDPEAAIASLYGSVSYKAGTALLWLPRSVKYYLKRKKEIGSAAAVREMRNSNYLLIQAGDAESTLREIKGSATYRVGRAVTWLPRKIRDLCNGNTSGLFSGGTKGRLQEIDKELKQLNSYIRYSHRVNQDEAKDRQQQVMTALSDLDGKVEEGSRDLRNRMDRTEKQLAGTGTAVCEGFRAQEKNERENRRLLWSSVTTGKETLWAEIYNNTVSGSDWLTDRSFSPGRWAVGYPLLYVLYRILDEQKPKTILEMGLGQSSRMITQYAMRHPECLHQVVEQSGEWKTFFTADNELASNTDIRILECGMEPYGDPPHEIRVYKDFEAYIGDRRYDLICVDGPSSEGRDHYSRIDVLKMIPRNLDSRFVIILDDCNREGEENTAKEISALLQANGIPFCDGSYQGEKRFRIWVSPDNRYLLSL